MDTGNVVLLGEETSEDLLEKTGFRELLRRNMYTVHLRSLQGRIPAFEEIAWSESHAPSYDSDKRVRVVGAYVA